MSSCQDPGSPPVPGAVTETTTAPPAASASPSGSSSPSSGNPGVYKPADSKGKAENVPVPVMPELAKENSKEGLEAFIRYWYATYSYALETGDMGAWSACTDMTTPAARAHKESVAQNYIENRWIVGGRLTTPTVEIAWDADGLQPQSAKVQVIQEAIQYFDADGAKGQEDSPSTNTADAVFSRFEDDAWRVTDYGALVG
ncbi:DUF6318 family protein [Paenarthrobacter ureafaciens]|uniref:DUF6318 family protein n=1 Tax=Paenarthrobacter ureafaciens TaxID=37931 RepID=UPI00140CD9C2|nr:DUF6318 family protein [Paenarthrobacter ureafaciens]MCX8455899.1 DUF6318 family protein [Paenarthrobacter ureafaciens]MCY0974375.1 DUF6318 family protein [Paenarthrobacter ureafaciens]